MASRAFQEINNAKELAKAVNLPQVACNMGYTLVRSGDGYMCKEMDSLKFYKKGDYWRWHRFSTDQGGDAIAFVQEFSNCTKFMDAINYLVGDSVTYTKVKTTKTPKYFKTAPEPPKIFKPPEESTSTNRIYAYLTKTRGLDGEFINDFIDAGYIVQEKTHGNAVFKIKDENGKYIGAEAVGTYTGSRFKQIYEGLKEGYGFEICLGSGDSAYFFESAIDMLSFMQINRDDIWNCRFISMGGLKHTIVEKTVERYGIHPENIYICSDYDEKGNLFADKMKESFPDSNRIAPPSEKDWNDYIRSENYAKRLSLEKRCKELQRRYETKVNALGLESCISYYSQMCADFLSSAGIETKEEDISGRLAEKDLPGSSDIILACLNETTNIVFENGLGDYEIREGNENNYRLTDIYDRIIEEGDINSILQSLKNILAKEMKKENLKPIGR